jgi:hypothetical protein
MERAKLLLQVRPFQQSKNERDPRGHEVANVLYPHRCGNVASILELDENLRQEYKVFENAPHVSTCRNLAWPDFDASPIYCFCRM